MFQFSFFSFSDEEKIDYFENFTKVIILRISSVNIVESISSDEPRIVMKKLIA